MTRPTLTERRAEELRLSVALAARDIFLADGTTSATIERICEVAGIAPRTFHRHFAAKEDVVMPLFRQYGNRSIGILQCAPPTIGTSEALVSAFSAEVSKRGEFEIDRQLMSLIVGEPQYRLRWLEWGEDLVNPITDFLATRVELDIDEFARMLPAHLIIQTCRQAYIAWADSGDFDSLECKLAVGMDFILRSLPGHVTRVTTLKGS